MGDLLLDLQGIYKDFGPQAPVLHDIHLQLKQGSFSAIIGPSGSGKSTLLNIIGLLDKPSSGGFYFLGEDVVQLPPAELTRFRGQKIGFIFQFHHLLPAFTAIENVMLPLIAHAGRIRPGMREQALDILKAVGMAEKADNKATELSGGQQQRVAIARALVTNPPLVLADEPTGNLDTKNADEIFALLRRLNESKGIALLVVTHDPRLAQRCDRIIEVVDGRVLPEKPRPKG
ncbi:MAG TPA: ABC transporter ATP-binding protein [Oligoflexus sp.]|uniref:ABC transporter ATP-binding protein n=1 Tax=Oligoflexus sp. TaxID=1971216 RepID=UPI002D7FB912|nr:ABC transporter ATP-binding protein [Oligoflexus sp.]HET9241694.1 ABC transporter ATP-binding protein [Oligoflexus sp.]